MIFAVLVDFFMVLSGKIGYVLEERVKSLLASRYTPVSEEEFGSRFYKTYPFMDKGQTLRKNLEDWYISDGVTLCRYNHSEELEFRYRALKGVKNRDDYTSLSVFQILDFLYLIDCLFWVEGKMIGVQIASMFTSKDRLKGGPKGFPLRRGNNEFSKYSSVRSPAKRGILGWLDKMVVVYTDTEYLSSPSNASVLVGSFKHIANYKPRFGLNWLSYDNPQSIYEKPFIKEHKPFLITAGEEEFLIRNGSVM